MTVEETGPAYRRRIARFQPPEEPGIRYRPLSAAERSTLEELGNRADDWELLEVAEDFRPERVRQCRFIGRVRLGSFADRYLQSGSLSLPVGLYRCTLIASTVCSGSALHDCGYISHSYIGRGALLYRIERLDCPPAPSFGTSRSDAKAPVVVEAGNENGSRRILLHPQTLGADAFLQHDACGDHELTASLQTIFGSPAAVASAAVPEHEALNRIGDGAALISAGRLSGVRIGEAAEIDGPALLEEVTVRSSGEHVTRIGREVQLRRGLVGYGCRILSGAIAHDFFLADAGELALGARLIHSVIGENGAVECAELRHVLTAPFHAQHHNNSFLIAARIDGQSNLAAGATIGSNHSSRAADGEIRAGRGFWPALCSSLKYNSSFTAYSLLAKAAYPAELSISLPFALISRDEESGRLQLMPGYWFMYNMYALARNAHKYAGRDRRPDGGPLIESQFLAPDTAEELLRAVSLLEQWLGRPALEGGEEEHLLPAGLLERSRRQPRLLKGSSGWRWYYRLLNLYGINALLQWQEQHSLDAASLPERRISAGVGWHNLGGLLLPEEEWNRLRADITAGRIGSLQALHERYRELSALYPELRAAHGRAVLEWLDELEGSAGGTQPPGARAAAAAETLRELAERAERSRAKDFEDPFRAVTFSGDAEARAVYGSPEDDRFLSEYRRSCEEQAVRLEDMARELESD